MRRILFVIIVALLALPAAASAKEITKATVCGADGCQSSRDPVLLQGLTNGGPPTTAPEKRSGVLLVRSVVSEPGQGVVAHFNSYWVPAAGMLVTEDGTWMELPADASRVLRKVGSGLELLPARRVFPESQPPATPPAPAPAPAAPADDSSFPWWIGVVAIVIAVGLAIVWRRRPGHGDAPQTA